MKTLLKVSFLVGACFALQSCDPMTLSSIASGVVVGINQSNPNYHRSYDHREYDRSEYNPYNRYASPHNPYNSVITPDPWDSYEDEPDDCPIY